jgi:hypothetical protein
MIGSTLPRALPQVISDAIEVVKDLGHRFLGRPILCGNR